MQAPPPNFEQHVLKRLDEQEQRRAGTLLVAQAAIVLSLLLTAYLVASHILGARSRPGAATPAFAPPVPPLPVTSPGVVRLKPEPFFTGEIKRLEPHLGLTVAYYRVEYDGPPQWLKLETETWRDGKRQGGGSMGTSLTGPGELSVSLKEEDGPSGTRYRSVVALVGPNGQSSSSSTHPGPTVSGSRGPKALTEPTDLLPGQPVAIWGWMAGEQRLSFNGNESIEDMAKRVPWAFIVRARLGKEE